MVFCEVEARIARIRLCAKAMAVAVATRSTATDCMVAVFLSFDLQALNQCCGN